MPVTKRREISEGIVIKIRGRIHGEIVLGSIPGGIPGVTPAEFLERIPAKNSVRSAARICRGFPTGIVKISLGKSSDKFLDNSME